MRPFNAVACGTPVIGDPWPGLHDLFPEDAAILTAAGPEDVMRLITTLPAL